MFKFKRMLVSGVVLLSAIIVNAADENNFYFDAFSVKQGGDLSVYFNQDLKFDLVIYRADTLPATYITTFKRLSTTVQDTLTDPSVNGAGWKNPATISIPRDWLSGIYRADMFDANDSEHSKVLGYAFFTVKAAKPGKYSSILFLDNAPTNIAYNDWGGKSLYHGDLNAPSNSIDRIRPSSVSLLRPGQNVVQHHEISFAVWAKNNKLKVEYASMFDLEKDPELLNNYAEVVIAGHNEYWSKNMRDNFDNFIKQGGNAVILSGNTMWWQTRIEGDQMVCYKDNHFAPFPPYSLIDERDSVTLVEEIDPVTLEISKHRNDKHFPTVTSLWSDPGFANNPENKSIGVSFRNAGYVNDAWSHVYVTAPDNDHGAYQVVNQKHWVFEGTRLKNGNTFGKAATIVGYEADGAQFKINSKNEYVITGKSYYIDPDTKAVSLIDDGTPTDTTILAIADAKQCNDPTDPYCTEGHATMVLTRPFANFGGSGQVFNAATVDWVDGLSYGNEPNPAGMITPNPGDTDPIVSKITLNVIKRFD